MHAFCGPQNYIPDERPTSRGHDGAVHRRARWHHEARVGQGASLGRVFRCGVGVSGLALQVCSCFGFEGFGLVGQ